MELNSKFNLNDSVYLIRRDNKTDWEPCTGCNGNGYVKLFDDSSATCPRCYGHKGRQVNHQMLWQVRTASMKIGQVRVRAENLVSDGDFENIGHYKDGSTKIEVEYMCYDTGVGTGTVYKENTMFATVGEASEKCQRLNDLEKTTGKAE